MARVPVVPSWTPGTPSGLSKTCLEPLDFSARDLWLSLSYQVDPSRYAPTSKSVATASLRHVWLGRRG